MLSQKISKKMIKIATGKRKYANNLRFENERILFKNQANEFFKL